MCKDTHGLKVKGQRNIYQAKKKAGVAILVADKTNFKPTEIKKDKEGHYMMVKESMQQDISAPNTEATRFIKLVLRDLQRLHFPHNHSRRI